MNSTPIDLNKIVQNWESAPWAPLKVTRDTCEIDRYELICGSYQHDVNKLFEIMNLPLDDPLFIPTPHLEQLDEDLSKAYDSEYYPESQPLTNVINSEYNNNYELLNNNSEFELYNNSHINRIEIYKNALNISASDAFELLRRCHGCGSADMEFGKEYCSHKCMSDHLDYDYPCHWNCTTSYCKICKLTEESFALRR